jgi:hypothetical protein
MRGLCRLRQFTGPCADDGAVVTDADVRYKNVGNKTGLVSVDMIEESRSRGGYASWLRDKLFKTKKRESQAPRHLRFEKVDVKVA